MSTPPIDSPVAPFEVTCQIGQFVMDSDDPDRAPDLIPIGGTVTIEPDLTRPIRVTDETGTRVVGVGPLDFMIDPSTGKLIHPDGSAGVELINPDDEHLDPRGWTYTARVQPAEGRPWIVTFGAPASGGVVDLGTVAPVAPSPGITANYAQQTIEARDQAESFAMRAETAATEAEAWTPSFEWNGTALSINGGSPVDLKGEKGDGSSWAELTGKPETYPSTIPEVDGLQAIIDRLTYDTGWRDVSGLLEPGLAKSTNLGRCNIKWAGGRIYIDMNLNVTETAITNVMNLPSEYRPDVPVIVPFNFWVTTTANNALPTSPASGYLGAGGAALRVNGLPNPGTAAIFLDLPARYKTPPTVLPGDPV